MDAKKIKKYIRLMSKNKKDARLLRSIRIVNVGNFEKKKK